MLQTHPHTHIHTEHLAKYSLMLTYSHSQEGPRGPEFRGTIVGDNELYVDGCDVDEGMMHHLLSIRGSVHLVTNQGLAGVDSMRLTVRPFLRERGSVSGKSYGYVGSYINELKALIELAEAKQVSNVLQSVLCPRRDYPGDFVWHPLRAGVPINPSQQRTVAGLRYALEKIQGPPGTGKSTTIFHIITARIPYGARVLVTCSRNVAVESIAQKLEHCVEDGLVVFGNASRIGETARRYLLDSKCERQPAVDRAKRFSTDMQRAGRELIDGLRMRRTPARGRPIRCRSVLWKRAWAAYMRKRCLFPQLLKDWALRVGATGLLQVEKIANGCKADVLRNSHIMLCTIASTNRLLREWEENCREPLHTHTVIVDECGCTTESSVALLMRMDPKNLIMVGDHKQLPPTSMVPPQELQGTGHDRSLLERCVAASGSVHRLVEQYRMHEKICQVVSKQFYNSMLQTPTSVRDDRQRKEKHPLIWVSVCGSETIPPKTKSFVNYDEISVVQRVVTKLRERYPTVTIAVLTFYKGQLQEMMRATPASLQAEVLTVDSCQGSEFDYVVLSTVRANRHGTIGFVKDKQRINVAISRSLYGLVVVGDDSTMSNDGDWHAVRLACESSVAEDWRPSQPLPAAGSFETVMDQLKGLQMRKREEALAQQEIDAVKLMEHQPSFRAKSFAGGFSGKQPSPAYTVIGAKSGVAQGKAAGRGMGGRDARDSRDSRDKFDRNGRSGSDSSHRFDSAPTQRFDLQVEEFPDLDEGSEMLINQPRKVACRTHGMYGCATCGLDVAPPAATRSQYANADDDEYHSGASSYCFAGSGANSSATGNTGRLRIDKAAAARFVAHGIGYSGPMPNPTREQSAQSTWGKAMQMSKVKRHESTPWGERPHQPSARDDERHGESDWQTCGECGLSGDALEPDCDNPGTYYCLSCWEKWEFSDVTAPVSLSAQTSSAPEGTFDPNLKEESLFEIFVHLDADRVREILDRFQDSDSRLERAFNVLLEIGDAKEKCYDDEFGSDDDEDTAALTEPDCFQQSDAHKCGECERHGLSANEGRVDDTDGSFYCNQCWSRLQDGLDYSTGAATVATKNTQPVAVSGASKMLASVQTGQRLGGAGVGVGGVQSIADKAVSLPAAPSVHVMQQCSEACAECNHVGLGRVDDLDGNFYCDVCWSTFIAAEEAAAHAPVGSGQIINTGTSRHASDLGTDDFWGGGPPDPPFILDQGDGEMAAPGLADMSMSVQTDLHGWAYARVRELLPRDEDSYLEPDVVVGH